MKNSYKIAAVFAAVLMGITVTSGCSQENTSPESSTASTASTGSTVSTVSSQSLDVSNAKAENSDSSSESLIKTEISKEEEESKESSAESSEEESSVLEEESSEESKEESAAESIVEESAEESSEQSESSIEEISSEGYHFDDEQIVENYHTATKFTSDEDFNKIFADNSIDKEYNEELKNASANSEMRSATQKCTESWKSEVDKVYNALSELLSENEEAKSKLESSQNEWNSGLQETEDEFYAEASQAVENGEAVGTEALLSADTAIMNYYKGRTAVLLEQIYVLKGEINLSEYGL